MKKIVNKTTAIIATSAVIASLAGCSSQVDKIDKFFDETKYDDALSLYKDSADMKPEEVSALTERMRENLYEAVNDYAYGLAEYESTLQLIDSIVSFNLRELDIDVISAKSQLQSLNYSKRIYDQGLKSFDENQFIVAISYFSEVVEEDCNFESAQSKITEATVNYIAYVLEQKSELVQKRDFDSVCSLIVTAKNTMNNYDAFTSEQKANIQNTLDDVVFDYAQFLAEENEYETAMSVISKYQSEINDIQKSNELTKTIETKYQAYLYEIAKGETLEIADAYAQNQSYADAITELDSFCETYVSAVSDSDITDRRRVYENEYVDRMLNIANKLFEEKKYLRAYRFLLECNDFISSEKFDAAISEIKAVKPIYLCEVKNQATELFEEVVDGDVIIDTLGNEYHPEDLNLFEIESYYDSWEHHDGYAEYYLGYQYDRLTGTVSVDDISDQNHECTLKIEGDGVTLFSLVLNRKTIPTKVDIDVSNVNYLKFTLTDSSEGGHIYAILSDFRFQNESD